MLKTYKPTDAEIMESARRALNERRAQMDVPLDRAVALYDLIGPPPVPFDRPSYGSPAYALAAAYGWITQDQQQADQAAYEVRRRRSLQTCHRHSLYERPKFASPAETGAYVPEASARIENDRNLTDGARRCARKILEETYRRDRAGRTLEITVSYLAQGLDAAAAPSSAICAFLSARVISALPSSRARARAFAWGLRSICSGRFSRAIAEKRGRKG